MADHTPGPWMVNKHGSIGGGELGTDPVVAEVYPFYGQDAKHGSHSENARLIASAPEMATRISALEAERGRLREALQPFWEVSGEMFARNYNKEQIIWGAERGEIEFRLRFKHFLEARAALGDDHD